MGLAGVGNAEVSAVGVVGMNVGVGGGVGNSQTDAPPMELLGRLQRSRSMTRSVNGAAPRRPSVVAGSPRPRVSSTGAGARAESPGPRTHRALSHSRLPLPITVTVTVTVAGAVTGAEGPPRVGPHV